MKKWQLILRHLCKPIPMRFLYKYIAENDIVDSIAGGETTATSLAAITFNFLKSHRSHQLLKDEVRARYKSMEEIDISSALQLPYLQAVIKEGMRIFPASSQGVPRTSPGITVDGVWVPPGVCQFQATGVNLSSAETDLSPARLSFM